MAAVPLPYAQSPTVGCLSAYEDGDKVVVTARLTPRVLLNATRFFLPGYAAVLVSEIACFIAIYLVTSRLPPMLVLLAGPVFLLSYAIFHLAMLVRVAITYHHGLTWEASPNGLQHHSRTATKVCNLKFTRAQIALIMSGRFRTKKTFRMQGVRLVSWTGAVVALFFGTVEESEFLASRLNKGLNLSSWTPPPAPRRCRIDLDPFPRGVSIKVGPRRKTTIILASVTAAALVMTRLIWSIRHVSDGAFLPVAATLALGIIPLIATTVGHLVSTYGRSTSIVLNPMGFHLKETGLSPSTIDVPILNLTHFAISDRTLFAHTTGADPLPLFRRRPDPELQWLKKVLEQAHTLAKPPMPPPG